MNKRLFKSARDKKILGVCGGIAEYFNIDPSIVRILTAVLALSTAGIPVTLIYLIAAFVLPEDPQA